MSRMYHKAMVVLCLAAFVGVFAGVAAADSIYDFDGNVGAPLTVDATLVGQDNWANLTTNDYIKVRSGASGWSGMYAENSTTASSGTTLERQNDTNWSYSIQDNLDFDFSVIFSTSGIDMSYATLRGSSTTSDLLRVYTWGSELRWKVVDGGTQRFYHKMAIPIAGDRIYRLGFDATANGGESYDIQPYYVDLTEGGSTVVNVGTYTDVTIANLSSMDYLGMAMTLVSADVGRIDEYRISQIPEPSTLVLLATGLIGLLCYAWRKRK